MEIYRLVCPSCSFEFPVDDSLLQAGAAHCPRCHHEWKPIHPQPLGPEELEKERSG